MPTDPITPGSPESLARHLEWLYGKGGVYKGDGTPCRCEHAYLNGGRLYGVSMGKSWARTTTHPDCVHHGRKAQAEAKRRQKDARNKASNKDTRAPAARHLSVVHSGRDAARP